VGAKLSQLYLTMGRYDYVAIIEAPDEATVTKAALALGSLGNIRTDAASLRPARDRQDHRRLAVGLGGHIELDARRDGALSGRCRSWRILAYGQPTTPPAPVA
jgi:hypothetical protein